MDHKQLIARICKLDVSTILQMSVDGMATLTDKFKEPLLFEVLCKATTNSQQRELIKKIRSAYGKWMSKDGMLWEISGKHYPDFMDNWLMDIECGFVITKDGVVQAPRVRKASVDTTSQVLNTISSAFGLSTGLSSSVISQRTEDEELRASAERIERALAEDNFYSTPIERKAVNDNQMNENTSNLNVTIEEQEKTIKELREDNERLRNDIEAFRNQGKGLVSSDAAVFITALCHHHNQIPQNGRENLAPLMTKIWGFTDATSRAALRSKITQERADKVAKQIKSWAPAIATIITKLPPQLEQENIERLKAQNPKKKNC